jgi:hypothetical protein
MGNGFLIVSFQWHWSDLLHPAGRAIVNAQPQPSLNMCGQDFPILLNGTGIPR